MKAWGRCTGVSVLGSKCLDPGSVPRVAMLDKSFILATSAIHLIAMVPACLLGLIQAKVMLNSLIHPYIYYESHETCHSVTFHFMKKKILQTML